MAEHDLPDARPASSRLPSTSVGTHLGDFTPGDWTLLSVIALIWGSSFVLIDVGLESFEPALVAWARLTLGAVTLACVPAARRVRVERGDLGRIALLGTTWMGVPLLLFPIAQQWIDSSVAGMINGAMGLTTAAWAALLLRRLPGRRQTFGLLLGFVGIVAVFFPEVPVAQTAGSAESALGAGLVLLAVVLYGLSANIAVPLQHRYGSLALMLRVQLAALVVVTPFGLFAVPGSTFSWTAAAAMVPLGMLSTGLGFVLMATLVGRVGGPRGSIAIYFVPLVAIGLGVVARGESIHPAAILGTALVILGAVTASRGERATPAEALRRDG